MSTLGYDSIVPEFEKRDEQQLEIEIGKDFEQQLEIEIGKRFEGFEQELEIQQQLEIENIKRKLCDDGVQFGDVVNLGQKRNSIYGCNDDDEEENYPPKSSIKKGQTFDVISMLSTHGNYLVRTSNGDQVLVDSLRGKYIIVCCFLVPISNVIYNEIVARDISLASSELSVRGNVEMVVVVKMRPGWSKDEEAFKCFLSSFSCLAVPFDHLVSCDYVCMSLNLCDQVPKGIVVDTYQKVLQDDLFFFRRVGARGFPFTDERLKACRCEDWAANQTFGSLEELLGCKPSDILYKNPGGGPEKVCVSELNYKLLGLYLCNLGRDIELVNKVYLECRALGLQFEIIVVYTPFCRTETLEEYHEFVNGALKKQDISWWVLPFNNSVCRRLWQLCYGNVEDDLIIVGPCCKFVEFRGAEVIRHLGVDAYPFSREGLVQTEMERLSRLTLGSLLVHGSQDYVYRGFSDSERVPVAQLHGKNILLYMNWTRDEEFYDELVKCCDEIKAKHLDFEVISLSLDGSVSQFDVIRPTSVPWFICPVTSVQADFVAKKLFFRGHMVTSRVVAFGKDGRICSLFSGSLLPYCGPDAFPFTADLRREVFFEIQDFAYELMSGML